VVDKLIKGGPTTEHECEENGSVYLVHDTDNEAEMDVLTCTDIVLMQKQCQINVLIFQNLLLLFIVDQSRNGSRYCSSVCWFFPIAI
jgi:hypothetical protein